MAHAQNITVSQNAFTEQELIEDVLFGTNCVTNITFTSSTSGNFSNGEFSYGYFDANTSGFPFQEGLVLTTGRLTNVPGPNTSLSDDDAPNWDGDLDLENALGISNTINATILEFSFVPQANTISFRYIFASEEYREDNASTCNFSDAFAFLIRTQGGQYDNLALIPGTDIPVQVTTVRPAILDFCPAENEEYFGQFNDETAPINFNGQTAILTAETDVIPGQTYEVKLVIADETNFRFDSAVFLEANSFNVGVDLGPDRTLCAGEQVTLQVDNEDANPISWFFNDQLINSTDDSITVTADNFGSGIYRVQIDLPSGCSAEDSVSIVYDQLALPDNLEVSTCLNALGFGTYNLQDVSSQLDSSFQILNFFNESDDAQNDINPIQTPTSYSNQEQNEIVYVRVLTQSNCILVGAVILSGSSSEFAPTSVTVCSSQETNPSIFTTSEVKQQVADVLGVSSQDVDLYFTEDDALSETNEITTSSIEIDTNQLPFVITGRISENAACLGLIRITLQRIDEPQFLAQQTDFLICENLNDVLTLDASLENPQGSITYAWSTGDTTQSILVTDAGSYSVTATSTQLVNAIEVTCSNTLIFTVTSSSIAEVTLSQNGFAGNSVVVVSAVGLGDYEYALNDFNYVDENIFDVTSTENTIRVRDKNGCGIVELEFSSLKIPDFFTPNGDGINDFWQIENIRKTQNDIQYVNIFDRYGKLITQIFPSQIGWDGTYNGNPLPSQDYWFNIVLLSGKPLSGHFTLKR